MKKIYVISLFTPYEGNSEPLEAFISKDAAYARAKELDKDEKWGRYNEVTELEVQ